MHVSLKHPDQLAKIAYAAASETFYRVSAVTLNLTSPLSIGSDDPPACTGATCAGATGPTGTLDAPACKYEKLLSLNCYPLGRKCAHDSGKHACVQACLVGLNHNLDMYVCCAEIACFSLKACAMGHARVQSASPFYVGGLLDQQPTHAHMAAQLWHLNQPAACKKPKSAVISRTL